MGVLPHLTSAPSICGRTTLVLMMFFMQLFMYQTFLVSNFKCEVIIEKILDDSNELEGIGILSPHNFPYELSFQWGKSRRDE